MDHELAAIEQAREDRHYDDTREAVEREEREAEKEDDHDEEDDHDD